MKNKDMLFDENLLIEIFIKADDLCKEIESEVFSKILEDKTIYGGYQKPGCKMSESEIMTLLIYYHYSGYKCFEYFYCQFVASELSSYFPKLLSYTRFTEVRYSKAERQGASPLPDGSMALKSIWLLMKKGKSWILILLPEM